MTPLNTSQLQHSATFPEQLHIQSHSGRRRTKSVFNFRSFAKLLRRLQQWATSAPHYVPRFLFSNFVAAGASHAPFQFHATRTHSAIQLSVCKYVEKLIHCTSVHQLRPPRPVAAAAAAAPTTVAATAAAAVWHIVTVRVVGGCRLFAACLHKGHAHRTFTLPAFHFFIFPLSFFLCFYSFFTFSFFTLFQRVS